MAQMSAMVGECVVARHAGHRTRLLTGGVADAGWVRHGACLHAGAGLTYPGAAADARCDSRSGRAALVDAVETVHDGAPFVVRSHLTRVRATHSRNGDCVGNFVRLLYRPATRQQRVGGSGRGHQRTNPRAKASLIAWVTIIRLSVAPRKPLWSFSSAYGCPWPIVDVYGNFGRGVVRRGRRGE